MKRCIKIGMRRVGYYSTTQPKSFADGIARDVCDLLQRSIYARSYDMDRIYSSHDCGIHFDLYGGGMSLTLSDDPNFPLGIEDVMVTGESSSEIDDAIYSLEGRNFSSAEDIVNAIFDAIEEGKNNYMDNHPEEFVEDENVFGNRKVSYDDVFFKHQVNIAKKTLKMNDVGVSIMGGMTKEEAREILRKAGWSDSKIKNWENS